MVVCDFWDTFASTNCFIVMPQNVHLKVKVTALQGLKMEHSMVNIYETLLNFIKNEKLDFFEHIK